CAVVGVGCAALLVGGLLWRSSLLFVIELSGGTPTVRGWKLPASFLAEVEEVCRDAGLRRGALWGKRAPGGVQLGFSGSVPPARRQRLRNLGAQTGLGPGPPVRTPR